MTPVTEDLFLQYWRCPLLTHSPISSEFQVHFQEKTHLLQLLSQQLTLSTLCPDTPIDLSDSDSLTQNTAYFQGSFTFESLSVCPDLIVFDGSQCTIYRLSASFNPRSMDISQLGIQVFAAEKAGFTVTSAVLCTINPWYKKGSRAPLFLTRQLLRRCQQRHRKIQQSWTRILALSDSITPELGRHCFKPTPCSKFKSCWNSSDDWAIFNLVQLPIHDKLAYFDRGVVTFDEIQDNGPVLSDLQQRQLTVDSSKSPYIDAPKVSELLHRLQFPLQCFDIEVAQFIHPLFKGQTPFFKVPFLYSIHRVDTAFSLLSHSDQLYLPDSDYRREFATSLIKDLDPKTSIVVFDATLEKVILDDLSLLFPDLAPSLKQIKAAIVDIAPLFINYHVILPGMKGKCSLKSILACLDTKTSYTELVVQSGFDAVGLYKTLFYDTPNSNDPILTQLKEYCQLDTQAIIDILLFLDAKIRHI